MPRKPKTADELPKWEGPVQGEDNPYVNQELANAKTLADEKAALLERIDGNRKLLRLMRQGGSASQEQADAIEAFYPTKTRNAGDDAA